MPGMEPENIFHHRKCCAAKGPREGLQYADMANHFVFYEF